MILNLSQLAARIKDECYSGYTADASNFDLEACERVLREGFEEVFDQLIRDNGTLMEHSGESDRREWHNQGAWLHPGDKVIEFSGSEWPLARERKP